jgi:hypothetical protein
LVQLAGVLVDCSVERLDGVRFSFVRHGTAPIEAYCLLLAAFVHAWNRCALAIHGLSCSVPHPQSMVSPVIMLVASALRHQHGPAAFGCRNELSWTVK